MNNGNEQPTSAGSEDPPVTAVASRRVKPEREDEFEEWATGITAEAGKFDGYLGSNIFRPNSDADDEYQIVFKFDHASNLDLWQNSNERRRWNEQARNLIKEEPKVRVLTGLETWFTLPSHRRTLAQRERLSQASLPIDLLRRSCFAHKGSSHSR